MAGRERDVDIITDGYSSGSYRYFPSQTEFQHVQYSVQASRMYQKRVPSAGKADEKLSVLSDGKLRRPERPFLYKTFHVQWPSGSLQQWHTWADRYVLWTGIISGTYQLHAGQQLYCNMDYPMPTWGGSTVKYRCSPDTPLNPDLLSQAEVKCLNKLRDKSGAADLEFGLWYAERHELVDLFRDGAVGLGRLAKAIANKDFRSSARVLKDVFGVSTTPAKERRRLARVERWLRRELGRAPDIARRTLEGISDAVLTHNLGISPLLNDLQEVHQRLLTGDLTTKLDVKAVARHSIQDDGTDERFFYWSNVYATTTVAHTHGYTVTLVARPLGTEIARLQRVGLTNPIGTLYQATRATFVLDYFWAMGQFLSALNVPLGFEFVDGSFTQRVIRNVTFKVRCGDSAAEGRYSLNSTERKLYGTWPVPIPPLSLRQRDLTVKQALNTGLLALSDLRQLLQYSPRMK